MTRTIMLVVLPNPSGRDAYDSDAEMLRAVRALRTPRGVCQNSWITARRVSDPPCLDTTRAKP